MKYLKSLTLALVLFLIGSNAIAQIPVEILLGHEKTSFDLMFFKYLKKHDGNNSRVLFFNRNRASIDYRQTSSTYLPQFGFTEALSYNHPAWKGFAPVLVAQLLNRGIYPKAGLQYAKLAKDFTFFSWVVAELQKEPNVDFFVLTRYTPPLSERLHLYTQLELVNAFPTVENKTFSLIQRFRLGLKVRDWQYGLGADFSQNGRNTWTNTDNLGLFLRHEF
ncbi:hypothetical protein [Haliscomenobacter sp.]|uniref:hypothetical protein n=1 Tax=Haliscomenobacter sp. TaxID=2717303 RepID=UPI003BAC0E16